MSREIHEERIVYDNASGMNGSSDPSIAHRERVRVIRDGAVEHQERIVEDIGAERRAKLRKVKQLVWLATGLLEMMIGLRIFLKLIAANPNAPFAQLVYTLTDLFLWPFYGLTAAPAANGIVLEISSFIAMIVYAIAAWAVVKLLSLIFTPASARSVSVYDHELR